jgi:hypothetical protein
MSNNISEKMIEMKKEEDFVRNHQKTDLDESRDEQNFLGAKNSENSMTDSIIEGTLSGKQSFLGIIFSLLLGPFLKMTNLRATTSNYLTPLYSWTITIVLGIQAWVGDVVPWLAIYWIITYLGLIILDIEIVISNKEEHSFGEFLADIRTSDITEFLRENRQKYQTENKGRQTCLKILGLLSYFGCLGVLGHYSYDYEEFSLLVSIQLIIIVSIMMTYHLAVGFYLQSKHMEEFSDDHILPDYEAKTIRRAQTKIEKKSFSWSKFQGTVAILEFTQTLAFVFILFIYVGFYLVEN